LVADRLDLPDDDATKLQVGQAFLTSKLRGLIRQGRFEEADEVMEEGVKLLSIDSYRRQRANIDQAIEAKRVKAAALLEEKDAEKRALGWAWAADRVNDLVNNPTAETTSALEAELSFLGEQLINPGTHPTELSTITRLSATIRRELLHREVAGEKAKSAAAAALTKAKNEELGHRLSLIRASLDEIKHLGDPVAQEEALTSITGALIDGLEKNAWGPHTGKANTELAKSFSLLSESRDMQAALRRYQSASGIGTDQDTADMVFKQMARTHPQGVMGAGIEVSRRSGRIPKEFRSMIQTAGPRSDNAVEEAPVVAAFARAVKDIAASGVAVPSNPYIDATNTYARTMGVSEEEAAVWALRNAPTKEETDKRREIFKRGSVEGLDLRKPDATIQLGEDMLDQSMWSDPVIGAGFIAEAEQVFQNAFVLTGDAEMAKRIGEDQLKKRWGRSSVTERVMKHPPERYLGLDAVELHPDAAGALRVQLVEDMIAVGVSIPEGRDDNRFPFRLMWTGESEENLKANGVAEYSVHVLNRLGTWSPVVLEDGGPLRWSVPQGIELLDFPSGKGSEYFKRKKAVAEFLSGATAQEIGRQVGGPGVPNEAAPIELPEVNLSEWFQGLGTHREGPGGPGGPR